MKKEVVLDVAMYPQQSKIPHLGHFDGWGVSSKNSFFLFSIRVLLGECIMFKDKNRILHVFGAR
jgi:hypothetical protein